MENKPASERRSSNSLSSSSSSLSSTEERERQQRERAAYDREVPPIIYDPATATLTYASQRVDHIPMGLWKVYPKTRRLDLSYNLINTLRYLENFEDLRELILDNNYITERITFPVLHLLKVLSLNNNRINDLPEFMLKCRRSFPHLRFLSLLRNKACPNEMFNPRQRSDDYERYRLFVIHHLPRLKYLDSTKVTNDELEEAATRGHLVHIRRPESLGPEEESRIIPFVPPYMFENLDVMPGPRHRGEYLRTKLSFANRESEGNRFITNQDL